MHGRLTYLQALETLLDGGEPGLQRLTPLTAGVVAVGSYPSRSARARSVS